MAKSILDIIIRTIKQGGGDKEVVKGLVDIKNKIGGAVTAFGALAGAAYTVDKIFDATVGRFVQYAAEVENTKVLTGATADETSRIIQMADDARVSYEDLTKALKAANKDGFQPDIEGLAALSDQFLAIQDPVERNNFLFDTFGKQGDKMEKIMKLGGAAIRERTAAIDDSLIVTEQAIQQAKEYTEQVDELNDMKEGGMLVLGAEGLPVVVGGLKELNKNLKEEGVLGFGTADAIQVLWAALTNNNEATDSATTSYTAMARAMENVPPLVEEQVVAYDKLLSMTMDLQDGYDNFAEKEREIRDEMDQVTQAVANGDITADEYNEKMSALSGQLAENASAMEDWSKRTVFSLIQARLAAEGGIDAKEFGFLINLGEQMGIIDSSTAQMAQGVNESLDAIDLNKPEEFYDLWKDIIALPHDQVFTITTNTAGGGTVPGGGVGGSGNPNYDSEYAIGGSVDAGVPIKVHADEVFVPQSDGYVLTRRDAQNIAAQAAGGRGGGKSLTIYGGLTIIAQGRVMDVLDELS